MSALAQPLGEDEALYAAAVGPAWVEYYRPRFVAFASGGPKIQWNWAAALVPFWTSYRKISLLGILVVMVFIVATAAAAIHLQDWFEHREALGVAYVGVLALLAIPQGAFGTWVLYQQIGGEIEKLRRTLSRADAAAALAKKAPRRGPGQDIVHGLMSAFLAACGFLTVALPASMAHGPSRGLLRHELRRLTEAQDSFLLAQGRYATTLDELGYLAMSGNQVTIEEATATGFRGRADSQRRAPFTCTVFAGSVRDTARGEQVRQPVCRPRRSR